MIRVFPRKTNMTPDDELAFVGDPPLRRPSDQQVCVSVTFTWDIPEGERLLRSWSRFYDDVRIGGPAFGDPGREFIPGLFLKKGVVLTSRGCKRHCRFCLVPKREGSVQELTIHDGHIIQDNNLLACSGNHILQVFNMLRRQREPARFPGGFDARLFQKDHVDLLRSIKLNEVWFARDSKDLRSLKKVARLLPEPEFSRDKKRCYVLVGFKGDSIQDAERRCREVFELGFLPFAMLYRSATETIRHSNYWSKFLRTWTRPAATKAHMRGDEETAQLNLFTQPTKGIRTCRKA